MAKDKADLNGQVFDIRSLGEGLKVTEEKKCDLTHDLSREILAMPTVAGERRLRQRHAANLLGHMHRGTFHWNLVAIITCRCKQPHNEQPAGTVFRINGQHTSEARLQMPATYRAPIRFIRYLAMTEHDMRMLYATIDRGGPRTKRNQIDAYLKGTDEFSGYRSHVLKYVPPGISIFMWQTAPARAVHDGDDIAYLMLTEKAETVSAVCEFLDRFNPKEYRHIMRGPVTGAMLATFEVDPSAAIEFWMAVATGVGFDSAGDPRSKLMKFLCESRIRPGSISQEEFYRVCLSAWNNWRQGNRVKFLRAPKSRPVIE